MVGHEPQAFLGLLVKMFESTRDKGSVFVTFKKVKPKGQEEVSCLVRAKTRKKKIATTVTAAEAESFNSELGAILEQYVSPLPKEEAAKEAAKEAAARAAAAKQAKSKGKKKGGAGGAAGNEPAKVASPNAPPATAAKPGEGSKGGAAGSGGGEGAATTGGGAGKKKKKGKR